MNMNSPVPTSELHREQGPTTSDHYRSWAHQWAKSDGRARELESLKEPMLARRAKEHAEMSVAAAEREVKASQEWHDFVSEIAKARTSANEARAEMDYLAMRHAEEMRRA